MKTKTNGEKPKKEEDVQNQRAIVPAQAPIVTAYATDIDIEKTKRQLAAIASFQALVRKELHDGHDFGTIPNTPKPSLWKPGAEKIAKLLFLQDDYDIIERVETWDAQAPFFRYLIKCRLSDMATGTLVSAGLGECNSMESKYRWRWVPESEIPTFYDEEMKATLKKRPAKKTLFEFDFALEKRETTGQYGKPPEYWAQFDAAIKAGTAKRTNKAARSGKEYPGVEITVGVDLFRVQNEDIFDQVNTLVKMAKKRALVDAALSAGRLSDLFTQDLEDLTEFAQESGGRIIDVQAMNVEEKPPGTAKVEPGNNGATAAPKPATPPPPATPATAPTPAPPAATAKSKPTKPKAKPPENVSPPPTTPRDPEPTPPAASDGEQLELGPAPKPAMGVENMGQVPPYIEEISKKLMVLFSEYGRDPEKIIFDRDNGILARVKKVFGTLRTGIDKLDKREADWVSSKLSESIQIAEETKNKKLAAGAVPGTGGSK